MPERSGKLSQEEQDKAIKWIADHWTTKSPCPVCGTHGWTLMDHVVHMPAYQPGLSVVNLVKVTVYPQLLLQCNTCAYTMAFSAIRAGVVVSNEKSVEPEKK